MSTGYYIHELLRAQIKNLASHRRRRSLRLAGEIIKTHNIASAGFHEYTVVNSKVFDNISPNGIDLDDFIKRLIPEVGKTFKIIEIVD